MPKAWRDHLSEGLWSSGGRGGGLDRPAGPEDLASLFVDAGPGVSAEGPSRRVARPGVPAVHAIGKRHSPELRDGRVGPRLRGSFLRGQGIGRLGQTTRGLPSPSAQTTAIGAPPPCGPWDLFRLAACRDPIPAATLPGVRPAWFGVY